MNELYVHGLVLLGAVFVDVVSLLSKGVLSSVLHVVLVAVQLALASRTAYTTWTEPVRTREVLFAGWVSIVAVCLLVSVDLIDLFAESQEASTLLSSVAAILHYSALRVESNERAREYGATPGLGAELAFVDASALVSTLLWSSVEIAEAVASEDLHRVVIIVFGTSVLAYWAAAVTLNVRRNSRSKRKPAVDAAVTVPVFCRA